MLTMLTLLCALVDKAQTLEDLYCDLERYKGFFPGHDGQLFLEYVNDGKYQLYQWKTICDSFVKYMDNGPQMRCYWCGSDWFMNRACDAHVCEFQQFDPGYVGPRYKHGC